MSGGGRHRNDDAGVDSDCPLISLLSRRSFLCGGDSEERREEEGSPPLILLPMMPLVFIGEIGGNFPFLLLTPFSCFLFREADSSRRGRR